MPIVTTEHFKSGNLPLSKNGIPQVSEDDYCRLKGYMLETDDIVFSRVGSVDINAHVEHVQQGWLFSGRVLRVRPIKSVNSLCLHYVLSTESVKRDIRNRAVGQTMPSINTPILSNTGIYMSQSEAEQKKIADLLSLIDERISTQNKIIDKLQSLIKGISNKLLNSKEGMLVRLGAILKERSEKTKKNNQYAVLSSTVNGLFSQRDYFSKDIASENNVGYKIIRLHDVVLSPQNLWMGNINYNDKFDIGIVSPSYKVFLISDDYDKRYVAAMLKTHRALYAYQLISEQGASVVRRNLNLESFGQLVFRIPLIDKQREIGKTISLLKSRLETESMLRAVV